MELFVGVAILHLLVVWMYMSFFILGMATDDPHAPRSFHGLAWMGFLAWIFPLMGSIGLFYTGSYSYLLLDIIPWAGLLLFFFVQSIRPKYTTKVYDQSIRPEYTTRV